MGIVDRAALNDVVWRTEWAIASAGAAVRHVPGAGWAHLCRYADQAGTHRLWLRRPSGLEALSHPPCAHEFTVTVPAERVGRAVAGRLPGDHRYNLAMFMPAERFGFCSPEGLRLVPACRDGVWTILRRLRHEIEAEYEGYSPHKVDRMIELMRARRGWLPVEWYVALDRGCSVGEVGLLKWATTFGTIGRLQDVDIAPHLRGRGLGRRLLAAVCELAQREGLAGICLRADPTDWPHVWYARAGFATVGRWLWSQCVQ